MSTGPCLPYNPTNWEGWEEVGRHTDLQTVPKWRRYKVEDMTNCPKVGGMLIIVTFI